MSETSGRSVVCNTGPLIGLARIGLEMLPFELFREVVIPRMVYQELMAKPSGEEQPRLLKAVTKARIHSCQNPPDSLLLAELDQGEAEVIRAAQELGIGQVLIDERKARRVAARIYHLHVKGSAGLLVDAKRAGLVPRVAPHLENMIRSGYHLGPNLVQACLQAAEE
jgi:uncharacterized protein